MPNLVLSPSVAIPNSQGSDKLPVSGTSSFHSGSQDSDFKKVLTKAVNNHPSVAKKKISSFKQANLFDSDKQVGSLQNAEQPVKQVQSKPQLTQNLSSQQSDTTSKDQPADQKEASLEGASGKDSVFENKTTTSKTKQSGADADTNAMNPLASEVCMQPVGTLQVAQDNSTDGAANQVSVDAARALDVQTPNSSNTTVNTAVTGNDVKNDEKANTEDPIHDLTGGASFLKELMNADDSKISPLALSNAPELSLMQNNSFQGGGILSASSLSSQIPGNADLGTTAAVTTQNAVNQQVALENQLNTNTEGQDKTKGIVDSKTTDGTSDKSVAIQTPFVVQKADVPSNSLDAASKDANGAAPLKLNQETSQSATADKGAVLPNSLPVTQVSAANAKGQTLNLPIIQTQLSVNNQNDKNRNDSAMAVSVDHPHTTDTSITATANAGTTESINKDDLFAQIVEKAKVSLNHGNSEMEVNLKPDHLGKLHLKISVENQLVTAKFVAESQQVKEIIETNLNQLRRNLQDNGIQVDQLMVSVGQQHNDGGFQNSPHNSSGFAGQHSNPSAVNTELTGKSTDHQVRSRNSGGETAIDLIA